MSVSPSTEDRQAFAGKRIALVGKFAGRNKREAGRLIREQGGTLASQPGPDVDRIVVGEADLPLRALDDADGWLDDATRTQVEAGRLAILSETELWQLLGLVGDDPWDVRRLYTTAMLADLLKVPTATIRRWHRRGLITPKVEIRRLAYFDFQEVAGARHLARVLAEGISPRLLEKKLARLARFFPGIERGLSQLSIIVQGKDILLRQGDGLLDSGGQLRFDFEGDDENAVASADDDAPPASMRMPESDVPPDVAQEGSVTTPDDMLESAMTLEDEGKLAEAVEMYRAVLGTQGPDAEVIFRLAELLYRCGDVSAARERYYGVLELDEEYVEARANLGCVLAELDEQDLAIAAFQGALAFHADYADVHFHLARILDDTGRRAEATPHWQRFLVLAPESPWAHEAERRLACEETEETCEETVDP